MKAVNILINSIVGLVFCSAVANAQDEVLQLKFEGICHVTNASGQFVQQTVNNKTLLRAFANQNGITNLNALALVYHVKGDERGDVIEIVRAKTGEVLSEVFGLFFPTDLPNGDASAFWQHSYVYNNQQSISIGSSQVKHKLTTDSNGNPSRTINGKMMYYLLPEGTRGLRLCTATISASKLFVPRDQTTTTTSTRSSTVRSGMASSTGSPPPIPTSILVLAENL